MRLREEDVVFLVDECAGSHVADGIIEAGGKAILLASILGEGAKDVDWIPRVVEFGCNAYITRDSAQRGNRSERPLLETCGVHVFFLSAGNAKFAELRARACEQYRAMARYVVTHATPFIARVNASGVALVLDSGRRAAQRRD